MNTDINDEIEKLYFERLVEGDVEVTRTERTDENGTTNSVSTKIKKNANTLLEYLKASNPTKWNPPPPKFDMTLTQNTINMSIAALQDLLATETADG
jgi:hypothetical protein